MENNLVALSNNHYVVELPEGMTRWSIDKDDGDSLVFLGSPGAYKVIDLPSGSWAIVGIASGLSDIEWKKIIPGYVQEDEFYEISYADYSIPGRFVLDPTESGLSLLKSKNLNPDTSLIIKKQ